MTRHEMPAGASHATPISDEAPSRDQAAGGFRGQTTESSGIVAQHDAERKADATEIIDIDGTTIVAADLARLPDQINEAVRAAEGHAGQAVQAALKAGALLNQAKALVPHGRWESWLTDNCTVAVRTAQAYMRLATKLPTLPAESATAVALLPLREAVQAISTPPTAPPRAAGYRPARTEGERASKVLGGAGHTCRNLARELQFNFRDIKVTRIKSARDKLAAAVAELDRMIGVAAPPTAEDIAVNVAEAVSAERARLNAAVEELNQERKHYQVMAKGIKGVITLAEYRDLRGCVHPDRTVSKERMARAFDVLTKLEPYVTTHARLQDGAQV